MSDAEEIAELRKQLKKLAELTLDLSKVCEKLEARVTKLEGRTVSPPLDLMRFR